MTYLPFVLFLKDMEEVKGNGLIGKVLDTET